MKAKDTLSIVAHLTQCNDPSQMMARTAQELTAFTRMELMRLAGKAGNDVLVSDAVGEIHSVLREKAAHEGPEKVGARSVSCPASGN